MHKFGVVVVTLLLSISLQAQPVDGLYQAIVPVQNQSERIADLKQALLQVIVKLTGRQAVIDEFKPRLEALSEDSLMQLVKSVAYHNQPAYPGSAAPQSLQVTFFTANVDQFLGDTLRWSSNRPLLLIWAVMLDAQHPLLVNAETQVDIYAALKAAAWQRGFPILFPVLDLEDRQAMPAAKLATLSSADILAASKRYGPDLTLSVVLRPSAQGWQTEWRVHTEPRPLEWSRTGLDLPLLLQDGMASLVDVLANQYVKQFNAPSQSFDIVVEAVSKLDQFSRVQTYLGELDILTDIQLVEADAARLHFRLTGRGGSQGFAQATQIGGVLRLDEQASTPDVTVYRLSGY